ncbi:T9SS type A sorting domain-containing protein [Hymenobacter sediminis]|uniref:T9SS type A sorting domain-containing protein n=1 Tax=Hymenobacter sediminis TaxID=2218621 RepID=UPI00138FC8B4|nr:T9SS type A sorting domain-containing protein [Hymenobacter sediminis]
MPKPIDLARVVGSDITLLGSYDTLKLTLWLDPVTRRNFVIDKSDSSQILDAWAFRYRRLYYLAEPVGDSGYWVHAVRIRGRQIQGLGTGYQQMKDLAGAIRRGYAPGLVRFQRASGDSMRLRFNSAELQSFYLAELDSFPTYRMQVKRSTATGQRLSVAHSSNTLYCYPNPASVTTMLHFTSAETRTIQLYDMRGRLLQVHHTQAPELRVSVEPLATGTYIVQSFSAGSKSAETIKLMVNHQ